MAKKKAAPRKPPTPTRFPDDVLDRLKEEAKKESRSMNNMVVYIVKKYLKMK